ncbi:MAG: mechanosensitive ion channel [Rhodospirillales bacterium]|nr:mechanosensitive ion channel [Rhodospirillales bacterium]
MEMMFDWSAPIVAAASRMLQDLLEYLPQLAGALATLLIGWLVARILRGLTIRLIGGLDRFSDILGWGKFFARGTNKEAIARIIGNILYWVVILFFLTSATNMLGMSMFSSWLDRLVDHLPNVLSGGLIIFAGVIFGNLAHDAAQTAAQNMPPRTRSLLGRGAQIFTLVTMVVIGVDQIGVDITLLITVMAVVTGALLGGLAIAFSLGSRTFVSNLIGARYLSKDYRVGERIRIGQIEGVILEFTNVSMVVETPEGRTTVPAKMFGEEASSLIQRENSDAG